jgi:tetratricopeptide (TPR) repeat protein
MALCVFALALSSRAFADAEFEKLYSAKKYGEALEYAEANIPMDKRSPQIWVKIAQANEAQGFTEKALACYLVAWRTDSGEYEALLGAARIYNKMEQPENAVTMAEGALKVNFTAEASWEYARACIALKKPADAKKALEKVIASDSGNVIANRELGNIYYNDKEFAKGLPLMKRSYNEKADGEVAFRIGRAYLETGALDSAMAYLKIAIDRKSNVSDASLYVARAQFGLKSYGEAIAGFGGVAKGKMAAVDYYMLGFAKEATNDAAGALEAYRSAVAAFGNEKKKKEALLARAYVARAQLKNKAVADALKNLQFIASADEKGAAVKDIHFLLADAYAANKDNAKAIGSLEKAISLDKGNVEAYARLAELYEKAGQGDKAKKTYEQMMAVSPNDPNVFIALGNYNVKLKKWGEALQMFEKSNGLQKSAAAYEGIAVASFGAGHLPKALEAAKAATALDPNVTEARAVLTRVYISDKNYKAAQEQAEFLCRKDMNNLEYLKMLAICYERNGYKGKLAEVDKHVVTLDKNDPEPRLRLAAFSESKGDIDVALKMYKEAAALDPKNPVPYRQLAGISNQKKQNADAAAYIRKYLELKPNDAEAHRDLGDFLYNQNDPDGALASYRTALKIDPGIKGFHKRYAEIVIAKGQTAEVITALTGVIKSGDADVGTYTTLGMIYQTRKQFRDAIDMYSRALKLEPANYEALAALGNCQSGAGDVNAAIITFEQAVMMNPNAAQEHKELGDLYTKQKKGGEALRAYMKYLDKTPTDKAIAAIVGRLLFEEKNYADAAKYLSQSQTADPALLLMYAEASINAKSPANAVPALEDLRNRKPRVANIGKVLQLLGEAYENDGKAGQAALAYAEYAGLPGVKNPEASYKSAFLQEKDNPLAAIKIYEANVKAFPKDIRNFLRLGLLYSQRDENAKALPLLQKCAAAANASPEVWLEIAKVYGAMNRDADELAAYQKFAKADPQNVDANRRIGALLMRKGDYNNAMIYLEIANTMSPNDPGVMALLARGYVRTKRNKEAIELLTKAKAAKPDDADIRYQLYELYVMTKQPQNALDEIKELAGMKKETRYMLPYGEALIAQGKAKEAEGMVDELLAKDPENVDALMLRAKILRSRKEYDAALEVYKEANDILPDFAPAYYERAETYMQASKPTWAETFYKRALRADSQYGLAELGLAKIAKRQGKMDEYKQHLEAAQKLSPDDDQVAEEARKAK